MLYKRIVQISTFNIQLNLMMFLSLTQPSFQLKQAWSKDSISFK